MSMTKEMYKVVKYTYTYPEEIIKSNVEYEYAKNWQVYLISIIKTFM